MGSFVLLLGHAITMGVIISLRYCETSEQNLFFQVGIYLPFFFVYANVIISFRW